MKIDFGKVSFILKIHNLSETNDKINVKTIASYYINFGNQLFLHFKVSSSEFHLELCFEQMELIVPWQVFDLGFIWVYKISLQCTHEAPLYL